MEQGEALSKYKQYIKENPSEKDGARKSFFDTFGVDPEKKTPLFGLAKQAAARKASIGVEQTKADYESEVGAAKGKAAGQVASGAVLGAATLATGGLATGPAMALLGSAGVLAGVTDETLKAHYNSPDMPKDGKALALKLGLEGTLSAVGEGGARAIGQSLKYIGKEMMPGLIMRSAAKAEQGQQVLVKTQQNTFDQLRTFARDKGNPTVDIGDNLAEFFGALKERATGTSKAFKEASKPLFAKLAKSSGGVLDKQPLDALMEIKSDLSHVAYKTNGMNTDELVALRNLTEQVDTKIVGKLDGLGGGAARKVYTNYKAFSEQIAKDSVALSFAEGGVKKVIGKALGAAPLVDPTIDAMRQHAAPWLLEKLFSNEKTAALVTKAVRLEGVGQGKAAQAAFDAAVNTSEVGVLVKDWLKPEKRQAITPAMQDAAQNLGPLSQMGP
jgi:hypothetical protein